MREALAWQKQRHWLEPPKLHAAAGIWAGVGASVQATCGANKAAHSVLKREEKPEAAAAAVVIRAPLSSSWACAWSVTVGRKLWGGEQPCMLHFFTDFRGVECDGRRAAYY
jgi:hypothetical protein